MSENAKKDLSDEFKSEIKKSRKNKNYLGTALAVIAIVLIFGSIGIALYQLVEKQETGESGSVADKIISRPKVEATPSPSTTPTPTPAATPTPTPAVGYVNYTVVEGDTWSSIANANSMTSAKLMEYNGSTSEGLQIGQVIKVPK